MKSTKILKRKYNIFFVYGNLQLVTVDLIEKVILNGRKKNLRKKVLLKNDKWINHYLSL